MGAHKFKNRSNQHKFTGVFPFQSESYEYSLYLPDFDPTLKQEVINYFGNRMQHGTSCLEVDESVVENYIDNDDISAYIIVNEVGNDDKASGTLQIFDHCSSRTRTKYKVGTINSAYVWINDLCRISGASGNRSESVRALLYFMEQLTVQNLGKTDIYLFVDTTDAANKLGLMRLYQDKYGFIENSELDASICHQFWPDTVVMKKPHLIPETSNIDFSFLNKRRRINGGTNHKRNYKRKRRTRRNKKVPRFR